MNAGNLHTKSVENHVFVIHVPALVDRGIGSFSLKAYEEFQKTQFCKDLQNIADCDPTATNPVQFAGQETSGKYKVFVEGTGYEERTVNLDELIGWIKKYENKQTEDDVASTHATDPDDDANLLQEIIESLDSEVVFGQVTCHIYDIGTRRNDRTLSSRGAPMITDTPRRKTGGRYHYSASKRLQKKKAKPNLGTYIDVQSLDISDPAATVTAPLKISYNESLGCYESSNQLLARLITDLNPAEISAVSFSVDDLSSKYKSDIEFYTPSSDKYMGQFSTALALPLSVKDGNPNAFGPNLIKDQEGEYLRVEAIRVVNRSDNSFDQGQVILCTMIDGEWIAQQFAGKMEIPVETASFGGWGFSMFAANSEQYFIDQDSKNVVTPAQVLAKLKARFFHTAKNITGVSAGICDKNGAQSTDVELSAYAQFTSLDLSNGTSGHSGGDYLHRCNVDQDEEGNPFGDNHELGVWWGPSFPDGFSDGSMQTPADIGTLGDYPSDSQVDQFPLENAVAIVAACNSKEDMAKKINKITVGRLNRDPCGHAYWFNSDYGSADGNWVGNAQYPPGTCSEEDATTTSTSTSSTSTSTSSTSTSTSTTTTSTTEDPNTSTPPEGPAAPTTTASPDMTSTPEPTTTTPAPDATTTPEVIITFPDNTPDSDPTTTATTKEPLEPPTTPANTTTTSQPANNESDDIPRTHKDTGYATSKPPDVDNANKVISKNKMNEEDPEPGQRGLEIPEDE